MIKLRDLQLDFAPLLVEAAQESIAEVYPWMPWCSKHFDLASATGWIQQQIHARKKGTDFEFALFDDAGSYIGGGGVNSIRAEHNMANIGYWIRSGRAGSGYGTAALNALVAWARENTQLNRLEIVVATGNMASQRVAEKGGAKLESLAKSRLFIHGKYHDAFIYVFTKDA